VCLSHFFTQGGFISRLCRKTLSLGDQTCSRTGRVTQTLQPVSSVVITPYYLLVRVEIGRVTQTLRPTPIVVCNPIAIFKLVSGGLQKTFDRTLNNTSSVTWPQGVINREDKRELRKKEMRKEMKIKEIRLKSLLHNYLHCFSKKKKYLSQWTIT
jgi:hypothetical protein